MVKKPKTAATKPQNGDFAPLIAEVRGLIAAARTTAASAVNTLQVLTNFEIGKRIVEHEQQGKRRAEYGTALLKALSAELTWEFGQGCSKRNLDYMRKFYLVWRDKVPQIAQVPPAQLDLAQNPRRAGGNPPSARIAQAPPAQFDSARTPRRGDKKSSSTPIVQQPVAQFDSAQNPRRAAGNPSFQQMAQQLVAQSDFPFKLSWTHYVTLLTIKDPDERSFYEIEAANQNWSVAELERQKASSLYERLALSRDKGSIRQLAAEGQVITKPEDILREPYVLEFLGIDEKASYSESDMETAIIDHLGKFLIELGKGFLFESRQKRFTFDEDHYFVDLVFYNRLLRCYVLIDLKLDKLSHQDLGQMQMYVNYFDRHVKLTDENPTIGLLLCKSKKETVVELTLPKDANIHAREYQLYLPSKDLLREKLMEWSRGVEMTETNGKSTKNRR